MWTYDNAGNITSRKEYAYTTGTLGTVQSTVNYTYGNSNWKDLLTAYNGQSISYDAIGNPTSMLGWSYTWEHGRQLASMSGSGTTWSFDYNADGMRYRRTNGSTTYTYYYNGDMLRYLDINGTKLYFVLDADGKPIEVSYKPANSTTTSFYFYVHNLMGDVMAILDTSGNAVVKYTYDAWGNIISTTGSMASTLGQQNPFRYRSYIYDQETGLYYLQSRYYNPTIGRFINADALVTTGQGILGNNMFAYCRNNPVIRKDASGTEDVTVEDCNQDNNHANDLGNPTGGGGGGGSNSNVGNPTKIIGGGHGNPTHKERIEQHIDKLEKTGEYAIIYGNRSLKTAGLVGNQRPDVIAVRNDGRVEVWEFASSSQIFGTRGYYILEAKIGIMAANNPSVKFHAIIHW